MQVSLLFECTTASSCFESRSVALADAKLGQCTSSSADLTCGNSDNYDFTDFAAGSLPRPRPLSEAPSK